MAKLLDAEKRETHIRLQKAIREIYLAPSAEALARQITGRLAADCGVSRITLDIGKAALKPIKTPGHYLYPCVLCETPYILRFYPKNPRAKMNIRFLKQIGKALETRLHRMEQHTTLQNKKEQWELAFDTITAAICLTDRRHRILRTNKAFRQKTGRSKQSLLQKNYFQVFFGLSAKSPPPLAGKGKKRFQRTFTTPKGRKKQEYFEVSAQTITLTGEYEAELVILRDITEQTKIEKKNCRVGQSSRAGDYFQQYCP